MRTLQWDLKSYWQQNQGNLSDLVQISKEAAKELQWWLLNQDWPSIRVLSLPHPEVTVVTDASLLAGAESRELWSPVEFLLHINLLELNDLLGTKSLSSIKGRLLQVFTDNTTAMWYCNKQGRVGSWTLCSTSLELALTSEHLPGGPTPGGFSERQSGQTQPSMPCGSRMATASTGGARSLLRTGRTMARSIRHHHRECAMSALLRNGVSKTALATRRLPPRVECGTPVRLSADTAPALSSQEDQKQPGSSHSCSSRLGMEGVVSRTPSHEHPSSDQAALPRGYSVAAAW